MPFTGRGGECCGDVVGQGRRWWGGGEGRGKAASSSNEDWLLLYLMIALLYSTITQHTHSCEMAKCPFIAVDLNVPIPSSCVFPQTVSRSGTKPPVQLAWMKRNPIFHTLLLLTSVQVGCVWLSHHLLYALHGWSGEICFYFPTLIKATWLKVWVLRSFFYMQWY